MTENYSVLRPEVLDDPDGEPIEKKNSAFLEMLLGYDRVIIAGQAKSHCVAWTVSDLLTEIQQTDTELAKKIYLVDDLTSPVVVPGIVDYTEPADAVFAKVSDAGMHVVQSRNRFFNDSQGVKYSLCPLKVFSKVKLKIHKEKLKNGK